MDLVTARDRETVMPISDAQVSALRAYLIRDADEAEKLNEQFRTSDDVDGFGELIWAAFVLAARRRFAPEWTVPDIVRYVAAVRARRAEHKDDFHPRTAEILLRRALGEMVEADLTELARGHAQIFLLGELIADEGFDNFTDLDEFMAEARALGDQLISGPSDVD